MSGDETISLILQGATDNKPEYSVAILFVKELSYFIEGFIVGESRKSLIEYLSGLKMFISFGSWLKPDEKYLFVLKSKMYTRGVFEKEILLQ